ncbi:MAG: ABC transporter ATP-binding protein [Candidatus Longimicrobiales bacterium M2_2A_002]
MPLIQLDNIEKYFETRAGRTYVLRQVSMDVEEGEFITVMGPSGAGKSTLLGILGMLDHDWSGEYVLDGHAVHELKPRQRMELNKAHIGFVFQQYHLIDDLTVAENLDIPLSYRSIKRSERQAVVADVLDRFQIVGKKDLFPSQLSGGQQQLVGVARAIVASPRLILADEPTGSLHSRQSHAIMALLKELNEERGTTIIQVTHSEEMAAYGDRIVNLMDGWVVSPEEAAAAY